MNLAFKTWCETRARFAVAVFVVIATGVTGPAEAAQTCFLVVATALGGGTLRQERSAGTLGFTLALPISLGRHHAVRAGVGIVQVTALAVLAALVARDPMTAVRFAAVGILGLALALAIAARVANEYLAWIAAFGTLMTYEIAFSLWASNPRFDLYQIMSMGDRLSIAGTLALAIVVFVGGMRAPP